MNVEQWDIGRLKPFHNNSRVHDEKNLKAINASIDRFDWLQPIVVDKDGVIIMGHGRLEAAKQLNMEKVPVLVADWLTENEVAAAREADNMTQDLSFFDIDLLNENLEQIDWLDCDMGDFGFLLDDELPPIDWVREAIENDEREDGEEYQAFVDKFEAKKTTDDCYTPDYVYAAVLDWVCGEYGVDRSKVVRPFYPGGDYEGFDYANGRVVVDNPPFSILSKIVRFYDAHDVPFFLFGPFLTLFTAIDVDNLCYLPVGCTIIYENGANVRTAFLTNMDTAKIRLPYSLKDAVETAQAENIKGNENLKYELPGNVVTASRLGKFFHDGLDLKIQRSQCHYQNSIEASDAVGKGVFGGCFLVSDSIAEQLEEADAKADADAKAKAKAKAEAKAKAKAEGDDRLYVLCDDGTFALRLSESER